MTILCCPNNFQGYILFSNFKTKHLKEISPIYSYVQSTYLTYQSASDAALFVNLNLENHNTGSQHGKEICWN